MDYLFWTAIVVGFIFLMCIKINLRLNYLEGMVANAEEIIVNFNNILANAVSFVSADEMEQKIADEFESHLKSKSVKEWDES